jgi:hypothetical protein
MKKRYFNLLFILLICLNLSLNSYEKNKFDDSPKKKKQLSISGEWQGNGKEDSTKYSLS